ncbi:hypothetical protein [Mesorhizobium sp. 128a]
MQDELPELFQSYMHLMSTEEAIRSLGRALVYYKISNVTRYDAVETAIIMSAAGLETLAGNVLGPGGWTPNMIRNVTLAEQIRACTRLLGIRGDPADQSAGEAAPAEEGEASRTRWLQPHHRIQEWRHTSGPVHL